MKKKAILILLIFFSTYINAQDASVEKSIFGIQSGFLGIWVQNESRITNWLALRSEIGLDAGFNADYYVLAPSLSAEPRWYYNLNRRLKKGKEIANNEGNFLTIKFNYITDGIAISNEQNGRAAESFAIIPKYGFRRVVGKHFNYEIGLGVGYRDFINSTSKETAVDLHLRVGYTF